MDSPGYEEELKKGALTSPVSLSPLSSASSLSMSVLEGDDGGLEMGVGNGTGSLALGEWEEDAGEGGVASSLSSVSAFSEQGGGMDLDMISTTTDEDVGVGFENDDIDDDDDTSTSSSQSSSFSSLDEEELELVIELIESEESLRGMSKEVGGSGEKGGSICSDNDSHDGQQLQLGDAPDHHIVEYWSVGKRGNPKTLLKKYSVAVKN